MDTQSTDGTLLNRKRQVGFRSIQWIVRDAIILDSQDESAIEDVDADLAGDPGPKAYRAAFEHLYESAKDLVGVVVEAVRQ